MTREIDGGGSVLKWGFYGRPDHVTGLIDSKKDEDILRRNVLPSGMKLTHVDKWASKTLSSQIKHDCKVPLSFNDFGALTVFSEPHLRFKFN